MIREMNAVAASRADDRRERRRYRGPAPGLTAICLGFLMITLDATIVNVALGPIVSDLGGTLSAAQWIVNGYTLPFAALLLSAGAVADRIGARAGFLIGLGIFAVGSGVCSGAVSLSMLIASRVLQGVGAAWLMPCSLALIAHTFPDIQERRRALAVWGGASGIGLASGPVLGGVLTSAISWRAIFVVNVPVAVLAAWLLGRHIEETRRHHHRLDGVGQALAIVSLSALTGGFIVAGQRSWTSELPLALLAVGVGGLIAFVIAERTVRHPMVDPVLFNRRTFSIAVAIGALFNFCLYGGLFCLALDLHQAHGLTVLDTGLAMVPMTVVVATMAFLSGRIVTRFGEWPIMAAGLTTGMLAAALVAINRAGGPVWLLVICTIPMGLTAMAMPAMTAAAMSGAPEHRIGLASGVLNTVRQIGGAFGVAILGALLASNGSISLHPAFAAITAAYAVATLLALLGHRHNRRDA